VRATYFGPVTDRNRRRIDRSSAARDHHGGAGSPMSEWTPTTCMRCAVGCGHSSRVHQQLRTRHRPRRRVPSGQPRPRLPARGQRDRGPRRGLADAAPRQGRTAPSSPRAGRRRSGRSSRISRTRWPKRGTASRCWEAASRRTRRRTRWGSSRGAASAPGTTTPTPPSVWPRPSPPTTRRSGATRRRRPTRTSPTPRPT